MGLTEFEEFLSQSGYCSFSFDRSLTTRLIEVSNILLEYSSPFAHRPERADDLINSHQMNIQI